MEYVYGSVTRGGVTFENLKTIGDTHSDLSDVIETVREDDASIITDRCRIVEHYHSAEDVSGLCYDWYKITDHYRCVDMSPMIVRAQAAAAEEALAILEGRESVENEQALV